MTGSTARRKLRIEVDRELCYGFGDCVDYLPRVFQLDDEDKAIVLDASAEPLDAVLIASQNCPVDAIFVYDDESGEQLYP